ncbi:MAG: pyruvate kinase [Pyrobaculum sp.]
MTLTKRVATLGPSTDSLPSDELTRLLDLVDGVRINLAHASPEEVRARIHAVRAYERARRRVVAVLVDLKGPSIRVGKTPPVAVEPGDVVVFRPGEEADGSYVPIPARAFFQVVERGDVVLMLDGKLRLKVEEAGVDAVVGVAESSGVVTSGKAVVVEGKDYDASLPADEDVAALRNISQMSQEVDYVSVSLARGCKDVDSVKTVLGELGFDAQVAVKIETRRAVDNIEELAQCGDYIVVARGDLGLHHGLDGLPLAQRRIISTSLKYGKPVAVATQLLDSMHNSPTPTRAEVHDVFATASAGVDSLWLTNETASGKYPHEAARWLSKILERVEYYVAQLPSPQNTRDRFARGLVEMANDLGADILVYSMTGTLARRIAKFRPLRAVYVGTPSVKVARVLSLVWALQPMHIPAEGYENGLEKLTATRQTGPFVATYGIRGGVHLVKVKF